MRLSAAIVLMLTSSLAWAQVHVTQPFRYFWDEATPNVTNVAGAVQVNHFEIQVDNGAFTSIGLPAGSVPSTTTGFTMFALQADPLLAVGTHTFTIKSCSGAALGVGCNVTVPFAYVLDPLAPPTALRLGVGT